ncbi:MAG: StlD/DarB family beta-ketosynthase [Deltaproteobacteria bacterium]|nr:MAG: StlD/DarB family beta-ketosynthase [Deltaproteobacteria bacterium]
MNAYITDLAAFLPNAPVDNRSMENILGMIGGAPSRTRSIILRKNRILQRYYAIEPATGRLTHTNAQLTAEAVRRLKPYAGFTPADIECLACGTSSPDQLLPGHGMMVHGELSGTPCEVVTTSGICLSGIGALKYAAMNVALGLVGNAVATGSELASTFLRAGMFQDVSPESETALDPRPTLAFQADFLRWMLSDGAGAAFLSGTPPAERPALRIDWIDLLSYANELETCMYSGAVKNADGSLTGWRSFDSPREAVAANAFLLQQDVNLLNREIIKTAVDRALSRVIARHRIVPTDVDWFLPHYSSDFFREPLRRRMEEIGFSIPPGRWFSNLATKGNTGSASIFTILEELFHSGRLRKGERLLCMIPESGRFSMAYMLLTVV